MALPPDAIVRLNLGHIWLAEMAMQIPVHGFLIKHPAGAGLVDTGYGTPLALIKDYRPVNAFVAEALRKHDVDPSDIRWIINSHLHFDHCGQNAVFPHAPVYVQRGEYERRHDPDYTVVEWLQYAGARWELLDGEQEIVPGVRTVTTPGHTPGHQSIVVDTTAGPALMTGDACWTVKMFEGEAPRRGMMEDRSTFLESLDKIRRLDPAALHFCHDNRTWHRSTPR
jgi:N-acyl homoserine lactone hydrolase